MTGTPAVGGTSPALYTGTTGTPGSTPSNEMNKDMFLKLLVAQLKYQDPTAPSDSAQFMAQTAQFSLVEQMEKLAAVQEDLLSGNQLQSATAMVGRSVSWLDVDGTTTRTGTVGAVTVSGGVPTLLVGDVEVSLDQITKVTAAS